MNHLTAAILPPLDLEAMWQNSLIRVSDQLTILPVVHRIDEAIIGTLVMQRILHLATSKSWH